MSDSESGLSNPNVFTFQNTTVSARGPNTNITNFNFRSKYIPRNFERQRYAETVSDQRSIYYRRETSPMSIHSACDFRPRNFQPFYNKMSANQSVYNGRSGSPVSMRSIDSTASVSAADIAFALNNVKFNKYDLKVIKEAYQKAMKQRIRKRIEKRRNMRLFLKGNRHRSGDDSGEQGSDSSISSDDCRSVQTYKENMSCNRSARIDMLHFHKTMRENNMVNDCTENFRQNNFKNIFSMSNSNISRNHTFNNSSMSKQCYPLPSQKDRFKNGFLLPSQRFNRSVASSVIPENAEKHPKNMESSFRQNDKLNSVANRPLPARNCESGSEEEIFSERSYAERNVHNSQRKRCHESDDETSLPDKKKTKISSPVKNLQKKVPSKPNPVNNNYEDSNNFEFAKPTLPVRKSKAKVQEKVIAKSKQPLTGFVDHASVKITNNIEAVEPISKETEPVQEKQNNDKIQNDHLESTQNSDVSMRPSFIKRKLFTQKLDVAEKANLSSDAGSSPQSNVYGDLQKEKNKARKLVSSQSCLNRDVQDDNNLLDLIHKIVPPDRMNATNQTTASLSKSNVDNSKKKEDDDKWDVTSVISLCNDNDVSDTFTDEDIFERHNKKKGVKKNKKGDPCANDDIKQAISTKKVENNKNQQQVCRAVVIKLHDIQNTNQNRNVTNNNVNQSTVKSSAKTFWDTDFESDAECQITIKQKSFIKEDQSKSNAVTTSSQEFKHPAADKIRQNPAPKNHIQAPETSRWLNNTNNNTTMNSTLNSTRKLNITTLGVRSHRTTKKNKCCIDTCFQEKNTSKPVVIAKNNKNTTKLVDSKNEKTESTKVSVEPNKATKQDTKIKTETKTSAKKSKPKSNAQKDKKAKCTSNTRKSPRTKSKIDKKTESSLDASKNTSLTNRPTRSCRTPSQNRLTENSRSSHQFDITPLNIHRTTKRQKILNDSSYDETTPKTEIKIKKPKSKTSKKSIEKNNNSTKVPERSHTTNLKPKTNTMNQSITGKSRQVTKSNKQNLNVTQSPRTDRPIRSCRTPSQNR